MKTANSISECAGETRSTARTNLFLAATVHSGGRSHPVKIRDLSAGGARIDSSFHSEVGAALTLVRGRLSAPAHVTWLDGDRCGLQFSSPVSVQEWMTNPVSLDQLRVDHFVSLARTGAGELAAPVSRDVAMPQRMAPDLWRVSRLLEDLGEALAGDSATVGRHHVKLQNLDVAIQTLTALAKALQAGAAPGPR